MDDLYVIARFNEDGTFGEYERKGRNNSISGYDSIASAKRGLGQTKKCVHESQKHLCKIVKANSLEIVEV